MNIKKFLFQVDLFRHYVNVTLIMSVIPLLIMSGIINYVCNSTPFNLKINNNYKYFQFLNKNKIFISYFFLQMKKKEKIRNKTSDHLFSDVKDKKSKGLAGQVRRVGPNREPISKLMF